MVIFNPLKSKQRWTKTEMDANAYPFVSSTSLTQVLTTISKGTENENLLKMFLLPSLYFVLLDTLMWQQSDYFACTIIVFRTSRNIDVRTLWLLQPVAPTSNFHWFFPPANRQCFLKLFEAWKHSMTLS